MTTIQNLPTGYTSRPATLEDIPAAVDLFNRCSVEMIGKQDTSIKELETQWTIPGLNLGTDLRVVLSPEGEMVGYVEVFAVDDTPVYPNVWGRVHPDHEGKGIGSAILAWGEARARLVLDKVSGDARVAMRSHALDTHHPSNELLAGYGMTLIRHSFQMRIDFNGPLPAPVWPEGIQVRTFRPEDIEAVYRADDEAFQDHFGFVPEDFETGLQRFSHFFLNDEEFDPNLWFLAMDGEEIAGVCLCRRRSWEDEHIGWISSLAVRRAWRKRGLGMAFLSHSFNEFSQIGKAGVGLGVDAENLTGALKLYQKAGMHVYHQFNRYEKLFRSGKDLSTH